MLTQIHPIVFLRPLIKQEWPAESNDSLQRYQDNLSSAKYLNLAPGGPQSIHTACFDGYIGAPPHTDPTMISLCLPWFSNGIQPVPCKGSIPDTEVDHCRRVLFSALPWLGSQGPLKGSRRFVQSNPVEQKC